VTLSATAVTLTWTGDAEKLSKPLTKPIEPRSISVPPSGDTTKRTTTSVGLFGVTATSPSTDAEAVGSPGVVARIAAHEAASIPRAAIRRLRCVIAFPDCELVMNLMAAKNGTATRVLTSVGAAPGLGQRRFVEGVDNPADACTVLTGYITEK